MISHHSVYLQKILDIFIILYISIIVFPYYTDTYNVHTYILFYLYYIEGSVISKTTFILVRI